MKENCPCEKTACPRHGKCEECKAHHAAHGNLTACERLKESEKK